MSAAQVMPKPPHEADELSFMRRRVPKGTGIDYWVVEGTGNYSADCEYGRKLADEYLAFIGQHHTNGNATLLGCIVNCMLTRCKDAGKLSGIELAFLGRVNTHAMTAAYALAKVGVKL